MGQHMTSECQADTCTERTLVLGASARECGVSGFLRIMGLTRAVFLVNYYAWHEGYDK